PATDETAGEAPAPRTFALLPEALRIVNPDDSLARTDRETLSEVEPSSGPGLDAPLSLEIVPTRSDLRFRQRALSGSERAELERVSQRLALPRLSTAAAVVGLAVMIAVVVAPRPIPGRGDTIGGLLSTVTMIAVCCTVLLRYARAVWLSQRI